MLSAGRIRLRHREILKLIDKLSLQIPEDQVFLIPDHRSPGDLETLLESITNLAHKDIFECLDEYASCLRETSTRVPYSPPDRKGRIFAYCQALGIEPTGTKRDYFAQPEYWNLDAPALQPLSSFLTGLCQ